MTDGTLRKQVRRLEALVLVMAEVIEELELERAAMNDDSSSLSKLRKAKNDYEYPIM